MKKWPVLYWLHTSLFKSFQGRKTIAKADFTLIVGAACQIDSSRETLLLKNQFWSIGVKSLQRYKWGKQLTYFLSTALLTWLINWLMVTLWNHSPLFPFTSSQFQIVTPPPPPKSQQLKWEQGSLNSTTQAWMCWPRRDTITLALYKGVTKPDFLSRLLCALSNLMHWLMKGDSHT